MATLTRGDANNITGADAIRGFLESDQLVSPVPQGGEIRLRIVLEPWPKRT